MLTIDDLIPAFTRETVAAVGLHKIAGAMAGIPELTIKEAVATIGAKAYIRRKQARAVADGAAALEILSNKTAAGNPALMALLKKSIMPAALGAGVATVPHLLSRDPNEQNMEAMLPSMGVGALLGGASGGLSALNSATRGANGPALAALLHAR